MTTTAAIIGAGFMGRVHARAVRNAGGEVRAIAASTDSGSKQAADEMGVPTVLRAAEDLAARTDIDVVHICTPNDVHAAYATAALKSGKHVVCEKPLAIDLESARQLAELAESSGRVATVPFIYRFYPTVREMRERLAQGGGATVLVHGSYLQDWLSRPSDWTWRIDPRIGGPSRAMADIGSHWCDLMEFVTGHRITRLVASTSVAIRHRHATHLESFSSATPEGEPDTEVTTEDIAGVVFSTDRGATGTLMVSQVSPGRKNRLWLEIGTDAASYAFDQESPEQLWIGSRTENRLLTRDPAVFSAAAQPYMVLPPGHPQGYNDSFDLFVRDTYRAIRDGFLPDGLPTFDDGLRSVGLVDAVLRSAATRQWVDVPTPDHI
ncbi:MAG TPA: Gfo/Idh/MocA family oxidoreductase [Acidimicrobiia bacterium]|nr:Gfo/Idh/MocA family oxidoreductase [Acidimicrobiia bacterium]